MMLGALLGARGRSHIEQGAVVFVAVSHPIVELWVQQMHADVRSLQPHYAEGKSRHQTYREMVGSMLAEVRAGRRVCGAFYGHPGVFAQVPHAAIAQARHEGYEATMEAAVSAEDCLYADLGFDPGHVGCQHYEASQLLIFKRLIDTSAYLVLWQVSLAGDRTYRRFASGQAMRQLLVDRLLEDYPPQHEVIVYEAATLPINQPRVDRVRLDELASVELRMHSTLVVPPGRALERDPAMIARMQQVEHEHAFA